MGGKPYFVLSGENSAHGFVNVLRSARAVGVHDMEVSREHNRRERVEGRFELLSPTLISIRNLLRGLSLVRKLDVHGIEEIVVVGKPGEAVIAARANAGARDGDGSPRERVIELRDLGRVLRGIKFLRRLRELAHEKAATATERVPRLLAHRRRTSWACGRRSGMVRPS